MKKYKVLVEGFTLDGSIKAVGDIIELSDEAAAQAVADNQVELVTE